jgi:hypothetical protein
MKMRIMIYIKNPTIKNTRCSKENSTQGLRWGKIAGFSIPIFGIPERKKIPG